MESNEVFVVYNFYSRVAKTTGIVKMSRKPFLTLLAIIMVWFI